MTTPQQPFLGGELRVITVGLDLFWQELTRLGVPCLHVDWRPPAGGDPKMAAILARLAGLGDGPDAAE